MDRDDGAIVGCGKPILQHRNIDGLAPWHIKLIRLQAQTARDGREPVGELTVSDE